MSRKTFLDLQSMETEGVPVVDEGAIEQAVSEDAVARAEQGVEDTHIELASDISEGLQAQIELTEKSLEGDGLSEDAQKPIALAVECYARAVGYKALSLSQEGFVGDSRKESTLKMLDSMKAFQSKLDKNLTLSQEGLVERAGNAIRRTFTSLEKINAGIPKAIRDLEEKGNKTEVMSDVSWARVFSDVNNRAITFADIKTHISKVNAGRKDLAKHTEASLKIIGKLMTAIGSKDIIADELNVKDIEKAGEEMRSIVNELERIVPMVRKKDADISTITAEQAKELQRLIEPWLQSNDANEILKRHQKAINTLYSTAYWEAQYRLIGIFAKDLRTWRRAACDSVARASHTVAEQLNHEKLVAYAIYHLIQKSAK